MPRLSAQEYWQQLAAAIIARSEKGEVLQATDLPKPFVSTFVEAWQRGRYIRVQLQEEELDWPFGWVRKGRHTVVLRSGFRGYPLNKERERSWPWFVLSQFHGVLIGSRDPDEETILKAAMAARGESLGPLTFPGIPFRMFAGASYPPAEHALRGEGELLAHYRRWEQLTPRTMNKVYPLFFGRFPISTLGLTVDSERSISTYADLVADFLVALDQVERAFGSPSLSEIVPSPLRMEPRLFPGRGPGKGSNERVLTLRVRCPKCGQQETPVRLKGKGKDPRLLSSYCRVPIFAPT